MRMTVEPFSAPLTLPSCIPNSARGYHARDARSVVDSDGLAVHVTLNLTSDQ